MAALALLLLPLLLLLYPESNPLSAVEAEPPKTLLLLGEVGVLGVIG